MSQTQRKMIYVADDEVNIRELIKSFLVNAGFDVLLFETGDALYEKFNAQPCDLIVLDIMMPGTDGLSLCRTIREKSPVPIIMVSARDSELDRITGITIGSDDYLVKPFSPVELVTRIQAIFRRMNFSKQLTGQSADVEDIIRYGALHIHPKTREVTYKETLIDVSPLEFDFLKYLIEHSDRAVSREELLKHVWEFDMFVDTRATDDVVKRLRKKIASTDVKIVAVWGYGFKLEEAGEPDESK